MKVYLAGKMRGIEEFNFPAFKKFAEICRAAGHEVFSPAERDLSDGFNPKTDTEQSFDYYMAVDLPEVCRADAIVLIPGGSQCHARGHEEAQERIMAQEDPFNHIGKSARHLLTHGLQNTGLSPMDGENHLRLALCRAAFAYWQNQQIAAL